MRRIPTRLCPICGSRVEVHRTLEAVQPATVEFTDGGDCEITGETAEESIKCTDLRIECENGHTETDISKKYGLIDDD